MGDDREQRVMRGTSTIDPTFALTSYQPFSNRVLSLFADLREPVAI